MWVKRRLTDGPGSQKGLRGGIKKILLRTGRLYWRESSDSREFNQYQVWCPGPAQPPFHWVTANKPFFLSAPQVHLCEMNVGVCPCSSQSSCSRTLGPGAALVCCSFWREFQLRHVSAPGTQVPWRPTQVWCILSVRIYCWRGPFRILLMKCHRQPTSGESALPAAEEELGVRKQPLCSLCGLQRGELLQDQDPRKTLPPAWLPSPTQIRAG